MAHGFQMKVRFHDLHCLWTVGIPITGIPTRDIIQACTKRARILVQRGSTWTDMPSTSKKKDVFDISQVQYAIVETNGQVSVLLKPRHDTVTREDLSLEPEPQGYKCPVVIDGKIVTQDFKVCNMNKSKVHSIAEKENLKIQDIMLMTVDTAGNHTIIRKDIL